MENINKTVREFLSNYLNLECEYHTLKTDQYFDEENTSKEYDMFHTFQTYIRKTFNIDSEVLISDILNENNKVYFKLHSLKTDQKTKILLNV